MRIKLAALRTFSLLWIIVLAADLFAQARFVYTNDGAFPDNTVSGFFVEVDGSLTLMAGSPFMTGGETKAGFVGTQNISVCMAGDRLYAANHSSDNVSGFTVDPSTGSLTAVPGSPFPTNGDGELGIQLACSLDGSLLFAANSTSSDVSVFNINADGSLTPVTGSPFPLDGLNPIGMKVTSDGRFLLVALSNTLSRAVSVLSINPDGTLAPVPGSPFPTSGVGLPTGLDINCAGNLVFVSEQAIGSTLINVFNLSPEGVLSPVAGSPFTSVGGDALQVLLSPDQNFLFTTNTISNTVSVFSVAPDGSLAEVEGSPFPNPGGLFPSGMATDAMGSLLYVANLNATVSVFSIADDGQLNPVAGSPFPTNQVGNLLSLSAYPSASCAPASGFDICIQDDSSGNVLRIDSTTGNYEFSNCDGLMVGGTGLIKTKGSLHTLQHTASNYRITARIDTGSNKATASIQLFSLGMTLTITDRNITNNSCSCE